MDNLSSQNVPNNLEYLIQDIDMIKQADDHSYRTLKMLNIFLYENQVKILKNVIDWNVKYLVIVAARGSGKTYGVSGGLLLLCKDNPDLSVGVFAPKWDQANRIVSLMISIAKRSNIKNSINWKDTTKSKLVFNNGASVLCQSASEATEGEGWHFDLIVCDESQSISDLTVSNRILPMLGSSEKSKIIKVGVPKYRNHFYKSFINTMYKKLVFDWMQSPILLQSGSIIIKDASGNEREYSRYVIDRMPLQLKTKFFPNNPELHYDGDMTETDFKTQYMVEWVERLNLLLSEEDQKKLSAGSHEWLEAGRIGEEYFFGIDFGSGTILPNKSSLDFTALSVFRRTNDNVKEKVFSCEWQGDPLDIIEEAEEIVDPQTGRFKCKFGLIDYSVVGVTGLSYFKRKKVACEGIMFGSTEKTTRKNWKNALVEQSVFELKADRVKYPNVQNVDSIAVLKKGYNEWCSIEKEERLGINAKIEAPSGEHDDHFFADTLAIYATDKNSDFKSSQYAAYKFPQIIIGQASSMVSSGKTPAGNFGDILKRGR